MQKWTKKKPDAAGYWWTLHDEIAEVKEIVGIPEQYENAFILHCDHDGDYIPLSSKIFNGWMWGSSKLTEPSGEKI